MTPPESDEPVGISHEEARQELLESHGRNVVGLAAYEILLIILAVVGGAIAFEEIDNWSQWVVLGAVIFTLIGLMIALNPNRRGA
jgi:uncharacterized protein (DUF983 family)